MRGSGQNMTLNSTVEKRCTICTYTTWSSIELLRHSIEHETSFAPSTPISPPNLPSSLMCTESANNVVTSPPTKCVSFKTTCKPRDGDKSTRRELIKRQKIKIRAMRILNKYKQEQHADFMKHLELYYSRRDFFFFNKSFQPEQ